MKIQIFYQNKPQFNGVCLRNNLHLTKDETDVISVNEYNYIRTDIVTAYIKSDKVTGFDSFKIEHVSEEIKNLIFMENILEGTDLSRGVWIFLH